MSSTGFSRAISGSTTAHRYGSAAKVLVGCAGVVAIGVGAAVDVDATLDASYGTRAVSFVV